MISEDIIMKHLNMLLSNSGPGAVLHHLRVVYAEASGPLGIPDAEKLETVVYAIAPDDSVDVEQFIATTIRAAAAESTAKGKKAVFAAIGQEVFGVEETVDEEARRAEVARLLAAKQLHTHPDAVEATIVYGACRDGRRWCGRRYLTGPKAGTTEDVKLIVGRPQRNEGRGVSVAPLLRALVGIQA